MGWGDWPAWVKGAIIGFCVPLIFYYIPYYLIFRNLSSYWGEAMSSIEMTLAIPVLIINFIIPTNSEISAFIIYTIIGAIIGWIVGKINR
ncbi:MAG: hypothetical protein Q7S56_02070 [Nanoarchaeota archaeon]|nr:hypothetical protein [Nanoarchaeota archaeon]